MSSLPFIEVFHFGMKYIYLPDFFFQHCHWQMWTTKARMAMYQSLAQCMTSAEHEW